MELFLARPLRLVHVVFVLTLVALIPAKGQTVADKDEASYYKGLPFTMGAIKNWSYPQATISIVECGAVGDGMTKNTSAIQQAIDRCTASGGGTVSVPAGIWLTGPIELKSNVNLRLLKGALMQFSKDVGDYDIVESSYEGTRQFRAVSPIHAEKAENIAITGDGVIDGAGEAWRPVKKGKMTEAQWKKLVNEGGVLTDTGDTWWPSAEARDGEGYLRTLHKSTPHPVKADYLRARTYLRPVLVDLVNCTNVLLDGPTFQNSPGWNLHPLMCENLIVRHVDVRNPWYAQNGDGIDIESCRNVLMYRCTFDVGDDAMCMKSGKDAEGRKRGRATENVVIADCIVYHGHGGFTIGSEMSGDIRNIRVSNCQFFGTDIGLRFKSTRGRGGIVENIFIDHIFMKDIPTEALSFNMYYGGAAPGEDASAEENAAGAKIAQVDDGTPIFRNFHLTDIYCAGARNAIVVQGLPEMNITGVDMQNMVMSASQGVNLIDADGISIRNLTIDSVDPLVKIRQGKNILLEDIHNVRANTVFLKLDGADTKSIRIKGENASQVRTTIIRGADVPPGVVLPY